MRFQKEAEAVARLQHPNIVQIYEVGQQNGLPYFSLEFVNAGSLCQFLGGNPQSPEVSARFMLEIARAMHYAHKRGIVHRDLKPANILLHLDEGSILKNGLSADPAVFRELSSYVAKISDFGLAKHVGGEEHLHKHGAIIGTPSYMAPEQAEGGGREVGPAADVYALGAVLYEMLTGRPPFKATSIVETAQQVLMQEPVPPTQLQPKIPRDLETICLTCLQKDPNNRYRSAEALAEDLRRFLANEPILASSTALHHRAFKWARRRPTLAAAVGGIIALAALSFHGWGQMTFELRNERDLAQQELETTSSHLQLALQALDQAVPSGEPSEAKRRAAILRAVTFYQQILREGGEPAPVRPWRAFAYRRLGDLRQQLGERAEADAAYQEAARLFARLVEQHPDRAEFAQQARECLRRDVAKIQASARE
jgi:serine/threonine protein kinase